MHSFKQTCAAFLIVTFLAPGLFLGISPPPKQAEAQIEGIIGGIVGAGVSYALCEYKDEIKNFLGDMLGGVLGSIFGGGSNPDSKSSSEYAVPVNESNIQLKRNIGKTRAGVETEVYKECVLDPVAWVLKSILINTVEQEIIDWVDTGFYGGPVFLRDPVAFAKALAREALEVYLVESGVDAYLCEPFRTDVVRRVHDLSTQSRYGSSGFARCTMDTAMYNNMVKNGSVEVGGIVGAMKLVDEGNNPYSAFFNLQADAAKRSREVVTREMTLASYNDGYHSMRCDHNGVEGVCTPGQLISKQVDDWLGGALGQLENADEVSEIVSQLVANLVTSILSDETEGLLGGRKLANNAANPLSGSGYSGSDTLTSSTANELEGATVTVWKDPDTGETWIRTNETDASGIPMWVNSSGDGSSSFETPSTAETVSFEEGVASIKDAAGNVSETVGELDFSGFVDAVGSFDIGSIGVMGLSTIGSTAAGMLGLPGWVGVAAAIAIGYATREKEEEDEEETVAEPWTNPDTGDTWGGDGGDPGAHDEGDDGFGCFLAGTEITMADGTLKPIDQITVGEYVLSYNESTKAFESKEVLILYEHEYEGEYLIINNEMHVTPNHITYINNDWKRIDSANIGDLLLLSNGSDVYVEDIDTSYTDENIYNLEIADNHNYFAEGYLVHNIK